MGALVEPEHGGDAGGPGPGDGELDPVANRRVLGLAHPPDVAGLDRVLEHDVAGLVDDADGTGGGISKVLSWLPYSSAAWAISPTLGTVPIVVGSYAPLARQSSMTTW